MCYGCYTTEELTQEFLGDAIEDARAFMGPVRMTPEPESERVARFVEGWHEALNYMEKRAGLA